MKRVEVNAEWMALVTLTCSPNTALKAQLLGKLRSGHFAYEVTQPLFVTIADMAVRTGSVPSIQVLQTTPGVSPVALQALCGVASSQQPISSEDDIRTLTHVLDTYRRGRLLFDFVNVTQSELEGEVADMKKIREKMETTLVSFQDEQEESKHWQMGLGRNTDELFMRATSRERPKGLKTGFHGFDSRAIGWKRGNLVGMAAPFKSGKSMIAYNVAINQYHLGYNVLYLPLEMSDEESFDRHLASIAKVEHQKIADGRCSNAELKQMTKAYEAYCAEGQTRQNRFDFQAMSTLSPSGLDPRYRAFKYDIIYVDYLNLMQCPGEERMGEPERLSKLGRQLKAMAASMNAVIVVLTQLDEGTKDLRYSKALKEHANNVWKWTFTEEERAQGLITVKQICARSWEPFDFTLRPQFAMSSVEDATGAAETINSFNNSSPAVAESMFTGW